MKKLILLFLLILTTGCANKMKPTDFKDQKPRLVIENYLSGNVKAWGVLQNRSGKVTRQFKADLNGKWDGSQLILDEVFDWNDGERQTRQWTIKKIDEHNYEGTASDVVGTAKDIPMVQLLNLNMYCWCRSKAKILKLLLMIGFSCRMNE